MGYYERGREYKDKNGNREIFDGEKFIPVGDSESLGIGRGRFIKGLAFYGLVVGGSAYGISRLIEGSGLTGSGIAERESGEVKSGRNKLPKEVDFDQITWSRGTYIKPRTFRKNQWPNIYNWGDLLVKYSKKFKFEPTLIAAQAWVENAEGDPKAYSRSGAVGLLQVMPRDGIAANFRNKRGEPLFAKRPTIKELQNPEFNVSYGVGMLKNLYDRYGTIADALKGYGPINVGYEYADMVLWLEKRL